MSAVVDKLAATTQPKSTAVKATQSISIIYPGNSLISFDKLKGADFSLFFSIFII